MTALIFIYNRGLFPWTHPDCNAAQAVLMTATKADRTASSVSGLLRPVEQTHSYKQHKHTYIHQKIMTNTDQSLYSAVLPVRPVLEVVEWCCHGRIVQSPQRHARTPLSSANWCMQRSLRLWRNYSYLKEEQHVSALYQYIGYCFETICICIKWYINKGLN